MIRICLTQKRMEIDFVLNATVGQGGGGWLSIRIEMLYMSVCIKLLIC